MSALPYMPLYVADYLADTAHLTAIENGAYLMLIMNYWQRGKAIPSGDVQLARIAKVTSKEWASIRDNIAEFFVIEGDTWIHNRIEVELNKVREKSIKASNAGKASSQRTLNKRSSSVEQTFNHTDTDTDTDTDKKETELPLPLKTPIAKAELSSSEIERLLRKAAGWEQEPHPGLMVTGPILALIEAGANLERDVLPVVSSIALKANGRTSWKFFIPAIRSAMNDRIAAGKPLTGQSAIDLAAKKAAAFKIIEAHNQAGNLKQ